MPRMRSVYSDVNSGDNIKLLLESMAASTTVTSLAYKSPNKRAEIFDDLLLLLEKEYKNGNQSVTQDKYQAILKLKALQHLTPEPKNHRQAPLPRPIFPPIFHKLQLPTNPSPPSLRRPKLSKRTGPITFKYLESQLINILETMANILDNLHLFSKFPMFPNSLLKVLKHTNRLWVLILVFLIRKTLSQLLNVSRKENKVNAELAILKGNSNSKLLESEKAHDENNVFRKYEKILRDLRFDKMMLRIELLGNFLDLVFNTIELYQFPVPGWFMNTLNFASMAMTIYRMNKDDEYVDDDITDDLI